MNKVYLGDAVYAEVDRGMLKLTTDYGCGATNEIFLEPQVYERMLEFVNGLNKKSNTSKAVKHCVADRP